MAGAPDFHFQPYEPPDPLRPFVRRTFYARGRIPYRSDKILPNGLAVAVFCLGAPHRVGKSADPDENPLFRHSFLHGVQTTPVFNTPTGETHVVGVALEPVGLHALTGVDLRTLTDRTLDARDILSDDLVSELVAVLPGAGESERHAALHELLATRMSDRPPPWILDLCRRISDCKGAVDLGAAYAASGYSARHMSAVFKVAVGVSPKVLCRIHRLQALLAEIDPHRPVSWASLAHGFGFYDQAHFNREFRRFSGLYPGQYLEMRRRDLSDLGKGEAVSFAPQR